MVQNAQIESTHLGLEGHGIFTFSLAFKKADGTHQGFGNFAWISSELIHEILKVVGVEKWEDLSGKHVRIKRGQGANDRITAIGNLMKDNWLDLEAWTNARQYRWREPK